MESFIQKLNAAIDLEYDSKGEEIDMLYKESLKERIANGDTLGNLDAKFNFINLPTSDKSMGVFQTLTVRCMENLSKYREGSRLKLHGHGYEFSVDVIKDGSQEMQLKIDWQMGGLPLSLRESTGWQLDPVKVDIRHIVKKSTNILIRDVEKNSYIKGIFSGSILPSYSIERKQVAISLVDQMALNERQKEAFINSYSTTNYSLIQGPPGTGKTWLLAHLAVAFAKEGKKVLITAFTHTAINNALQKASTLSQYPHIIKVGKKSQTQGLNSNGSTARNIKDFRHSEYNNNSKGIIVGATCYSPYSKKLEFMDWDVVIFDEAAQLNIPLGIAGMVKGQRYIFIGDHKQLPPIIPEKQKDPIFSKSIFEQLFHHAPGTMLEVTYRMNHWINEFPSMAFYDGKLHAHEGNANWKLEIDPTFDQHQSLLDVNHPAVLYTHFHFSSDTRSVHEAELIRQMIMAYLAKGISPSEIGVIALFRTQVRQIKNELIHHLSEDVLNQIFIDTVERIQGQERDVILFSLGTSNLLKARRRTAFVLNPNRLNVALTRARKKRIVLGHKELFNQQSTDENLDRLLNNFRQFYAASYVVEEEVVGNDLF